MTLSFVKALLSLVMRNFVNSWFETSGANVVVAIANLGVSVVSIPMYILGKRLECGEIYFPRPYRKQIG